MIAVSIIAIEKKGHSSRHHYQSPLAGMAGHAFLGGHSVAKRNLYGAVWDGLGTTAAGAGAG